jgi:mRNA interferase MazF
MTPKRGEVWLVDLGLTAKVRPCLIISSGYSDKARALIGIIPHTLSTRNSEFEIKLQVKGLKHGAFDSQALRPVPPSKFIRKLATLSDEQLLCIENGLKNWLGIP